MQRDSQTRLNGYGDLKTIAGSCCGQYGSHCDPWIAQVEIINSKTPELAITVSVRSASLAPRGKADPSEPRCRRSALSLRINL